MSSRRTTGMLTLVLGALTLCTGLYFVLLRPAMLPEDVRFVGTSATAISPGMERWLRIVFRTWSAFVAGFGLTLGGFGGTLYTGRRTWLRAGVAVGTTLAFAQFVASNFMLRSDFLWFVASLGLLALVVSGRVVAESQPLDDHEGSSHETAD